MGAVCLSEHRDLSRNKLEGEIPAAIGRLVALTTLCVRASGARHVRAGRTPTTPGAGRSNLSQNMLRGSMPAELTSLTKLRWL